MDNLEIGFALGEYEIQGFIGKGGMGVVYRARQMSLDRTVAIKVLPTELCQDHDYVDRFLREARAAAHLNHPNVIQVFDAGVFDDIYFFTMEYVDGKNLGQLVRERGQIEEKEALGMIQQVAEGLAFAHGIGIVHRDVKPENVMLTGRGVVKIGDLGLAKWKPSESEASLTSSGMTMGTPYYISPEQIRGWKEIDGRADIYSLGMTLYHLLSGRPAFCNGSSAEIMAQHLSEEVPPLQTLNPQVSQATIDLIAKMVAKKREDRIQQMSEVADILAEMAGDSDMSAAPRARRKKKKAAEREKADLWVRITHSGLKGVLVAVLCLVIVLVLVVMWKNYQYRRSSLAEMDSEPIEESAPSKPVQSQPPQHSTPTPVAFQEPSSTPPLVPPANPPVAAPSTPEPPKETGAAPLSPSPIESAPPPATSSEPRKEASAPVEKKVLVERKIPIEGPLFIRDLTISSKPSQVEWNKLIVGKVGNVESKTLIRMDFNSSDPNFGQRLAQKIDQCSSATLELTPIEMAADSQGSRSFEISKSLEIEISSVRQPWGLIAAPDVRGEEGREGGRRPEYYVSLMQDYLREFFRETNWEYASSAQRRKWSTPGAGSQVSDYDLNSNNKGVDIFRITTASLGHPLQIDVLPGLKKWSSAIKEQKKFVPHCGWILYVSSGRGEVRFASTRVSPESGPRVVLTIPTSTTIHAAEDSSPE